MDRPRIPFPALFALSATLISGCSFNSTISPLNLRYAQLNSAAMPQQQEKPLKIVSYNIAFCRRITGAGKLLQEQKDLAGADIICLQEMCPAGVAYLAASLRCNYAYYPSGIHPRTGKEFGPAILSRWPMENDFKVTLPLEKEDRLIRLPRCATAASVLFNRRKILVFSVHLGALISPRQRQEQISSIIAAIPASAGECVIAGDFNTFSGEHNQATARTLAEAGFENASANPGWTYKYWYLLNRKETLDHIFVRGIKAKNSGRVLDRRSSDHLPLWAECE